MALENKMSLKFFRRKKLQYCTIFESNNMVRPQNGERLVRAYYVCVTLMRTIKKLNIENGEVT